MGMLSDEEHASVVPARLAGSPTPVPLQATPTPMEPPFPMTVPTAAPAPKLPGVDE